MSPPRIPKAISFSLHLSIFTLFSLFSFPLFYPLHLFPFPHFYLPRLFPFLSSLFPLFRSSPFPFLPFSFPLVPFPRLPLLPFSFFVVVVVVLLFSVPVDLAQAKPSIECDPLNFPMGGPGGTSNRRVAAEKPPRKRRENAGGPPARRIGQPPGKDGRSASGRRAAERTSG